MESLSGVILSAGKGTRIDPFNARFPKPLLPIGNRPIMGHHLDFFRRVGIQETYIVVGHLMDQIIGTFGKGQAFDQNIHYVEQEQILGIAHATGQVAPHLDGPFVLCLGDIFYLGRHLERLVERYRKGDVAAVLAVKEETSMDPVRRNFTVEMDGEGYVRKVVEKPRNPKNLLKGCGIYVFGPEIFDAIRRTPRTALRDEYEITNSIQILIEDGLKVAAESVVDWDLNVTFPADLLEGNLAYLQHHQIEQLIDPGASIADGVRLDRCVLGPGAHIEGSRSLTECVVFGETHLGEGDALRRCVVSGDIVIHC